jgi:hypothetical protein
MAEGSFDFVGDGAHWLVPFSIASGATASAELDLGSGGKFFGLEIDTTIALTAITLFNITASSTSSGSKKTVLTSTGGTLQVLINEESCVGLSQVHNFGLAAWRFVVLNTTVATTGILAGKVSVKR